MEVDIKTGIDRVRNHYLREIEHIKKEYQTDILKLDKEVEEAEIKYYRLINDYNKTLLENSKFKTKINILEKTTYNMTLILQQINFFDQEFFKEKKE